MPSRTSQLVYSRPYGNVAYYLGEAYYPSEGQRYSSFDKIRNNFVTFGPNHLNYRYLMKAGQDATTSMVGYRASVPSWSPVEYVIGSNDNQFLFKATGYYPQSWTDWLTAPVTPSTEAVTKATLDFNKRWRGRTQHWAGGVFLGELRETAKFLRNPVRGLYGLTRDLARDVRKLRSVPAKRYGSALADTWLAYQFAAKPLASDANDAGKALRALASGRTFDIIKIQGTGETEEILQDSVEPLSLAYIPSYGETTVTIKATSSVRIRGAWKSDTPGGELPVPMQFGLSVFDIIPTAWEMLPWSFLVDYFTNVGGVLDAYQLRFVNWAWLNRTIRNGRVVQSSDWRVPAVPAPDFFGYARGGASRFKSTYVQRDRINGSDLSVGLIIKAPGFGSMKWLNITALATQILASKPGR